MEQATINFSYNDSRIFLCSIIVLAPFVLRLSQLSRSVYVRRILIAVSFFLLFIPLAFRTGGIDNRVYQLWYEDPVRYIFPYKGSPEPLFLFLILFARYRIQNFQFIYIISALLFLWGLFGYVIKKCDDYFCALIISLAYIYIYMCGVTRMSIAMGIVYSAFEDFYDKRKYFAKIFVATLFHYSALIGVLVYIAYHNKRALSIRNLIYIFVCLFGLTYVINTFGYKLPFSIMRYAIYVQPNFSIALIKNTVLLIPAIAFWIILKHRIQDNGDNYQKILNIMYLLSVLVIISLFYVGVFRLCWYLLPFVAYVYSLIPKALSNRRKALAISLLHFAYSFFAIVYVCTVFFDSIYITNQILPYTLNF